MITEGKIKEVHDFDMKFMRARTMNKNKLTKKRKTLFRIKERNKKEEQLITSAFCRIQKEQWHKKLS